MAWHIKADDTAAEVHPAQGATFSLKELQGFVGGYIEMVTIGPESFMIVNEDGMSLNLPSNERATMIGAAASVLMGPGGVLGDVLLCTRREIR